ncbi:hypothetical protein ACO2Q3_23740 [Caulobacter sp. KR2-114]|uniref:hypothetical protein n=1 Tax=Caulobacter sp. KR2-114 TaxID=3400912 RepID=UPI003C0FF8BA
MKKLIIALASASALLGAGAASAQPYHNGWDNDHRWHDRDYRASHDRDWHGRRDHDDGRWRHRYHYGSPYYGHQVCSWRYGERVCWYQR